MTKKFTLSLTLGLASLGITAQTVSADYIPEIYASVYSCNYWKEHQLEEIGIYKFSADKYQRSLVMQDPYLDASGGGAMTEDFYFCTTELYITEGLTEINHYMFDPDDWTEMTSLRDGTYGSVATDLAYDATTAKVFGCFNGDSEGRDGIRHNRCRYRSPICDFQNRNTLDSLQR